MSIAASNPELLLGWDAEIELLALLLDGIHEGGGALVLYGEPGIGKSRLLGAAAATWTPSDIPAGPPVVSAAGHQAHPAGAVRTARPSPHPGSGWTQPRR